MTNYNSTQYLVMPFQLLLIQDHISLNNFLPKFPSLLKTSNSCQTYKESAKRPNVYIS